MYFEQIALQFHYQNRVPRFVSSNINFKNNCVGRIVKHEMHMLYKYIQIVEFM